MKKTNKKLVKILVITALVIILISCGTAVFASSYHVTAIDPTPTPFGGTVIAVVQYCCYAAAMIWMLIIGVKYMTSSPDGKAEMKKQAFAALIGGLILFSVGTIIRWVVDIVPKG